MIRAVVVLSLMGLVGCTPVAQKAKAPAKPPDPVKAISGFLWPVQRPPPAKAEKKAIKPPKATPRKARKTTKSRRVSPGPDLPYPCWLVRHHSAGKSRAQLEQMARQNNVVLSAKQRRQGAACLKGRR